MILYEILSDDTYSAGSGAFNFQEFGHFPGATSNQIQKTLAEQKKMFAPSKWNPDFGRNSSMDSGGSQQPLLQVDKNCYSSSFLDISYQKFLSGDKIGFCRQQFDV